MVSLRPIKVLNMWLRCSVLFLLLCVLVGCGDPPLQTVAGKVTLDGKAYPRLIVYFRPMSGTPNEFNLGVGETDPSGKLTLRSTAGGGLQRGTYRVSFSCVVQVNGKGAIAGLSEEKADDDRKLVTKELVPERFLGEESPVEFEVETGENFFEYDIPAS